MVAANDKRAVVAREVQELLKRSPTFKALPPAEAKRLQEDMTKVTTFLADPAPVRGLEEKTANPIGDLKQRLAEDPGAVGKDFRAGAVREGVEQFGEMVKKVDFPKFVASLVQGVFQAVVNASIQQMQAYGELLSATSKTVDQFAKDNISDAQARDFIAQRYPSAVDVDTSGETARLSPKEGSELDVGQEFGMEGVDLSDGESEQALVNAAKLQMAKSRQQMLATMVLLGINRIVVTNGHINAKVLFDMRASDSARRVSKAQLADREKQGASAGGWLSSILGGVQAGYEHETTVGSAVDDSSESKAEVKAQLSGDVRLQFKSETFPLERMVDVMGLEQLQQRAAPGTAAPVRSGGGAGS